METFARQVDEAVAAWGERGWPPPDVLVVSGSGLAVDLAGERLAAAPLAELLPFPVESVIGHPHTVELLRTAAGRTVLYQRGRLHTYQGYDANEAVFTVRLAGRLGARALIMTNAAGGLREDHPPGSLVLIEDHLNLTGLNPLRGEPPAAWGPRFPDMVGAYDARLAALARRHAETLGIALGAGVYAGLAGPTYETPAEVAMLQALGADLAGMSTVLEVIAARHLGMRCLCFSLVANLGAGVTPEPLTHDDVLEASRGAAEPVRRLFDALLGDAELVP